MNSVTKRRIQKTEGIAKPGDIHNIIKNNFKKLLQERGAQLKASNEQRLEETDEDQHGKS